LIHDLITASIAARRSAFQEFSRDGPPGACRPALPARFVGIRVLMHMGTLPIPLGL
jgi:hypothetical protein